MLTRRKLISEKDYTNNIAPHFERIKKKIITEASQKEAIITNFDELVSQGEITYLKIEQKYNDLFNEIKANNTTIKLKKNYKDLKALETLMSPLGLATNEYPKICLEGKIKLSNSIETDSILPHLMDKEILYPRVSETLYINNVEVYLGFIKEAYDLTVELLEKNNANFFDFFNSKELYDEEEYIEERKNITNKNISEAKEVIQKLTKDLGEPVGDWISSHKKDLDKIKKRIKHLRKELDKDNLAQSLKEEYSEEKTELIKERDIIKKYNIANSNLNRYGDSLTIYKSELNTIKSKLDTLRQIGDDRLVELKDVLSAYLNQCLKLKKAIISYNTTNKSIQTIIANKILMYSSKTFFEGVNKILAVSSSEDFVTRGEWYITADVGGLAANWGTSLESNKWTFKPYMGVNFNLAPINRQRPYSLFKWKQGENVGYKLRKSLSIVLGVTYDFTADGKINKFDSNKKELFGDFSLYTAIGIRLHDYLRLNIGALWVRQKHNNPLIDTYYVTPMPAFSLSVDLDVKKYLGWVGEKLKPKVTNNTSSNTSSNPSN